MTIDGRVGEDGKSIIMVRPYKSLSGEWVKHEDAREEFSHIRELLFATGISLNSEVFIRLEMLTGIETLPQKAIKKESAGEITVTVKADTSQVNKQLDELVEKSVDLEQRIMNVANMFMGIRGAK